MNPRITRVRVERGYVVRLTFTDGSEGTVDLKPWIEGRTGVFAALQDPVFFARVTVDQEAGTIVWPNGADLDPDVLYEAAHATEATYSNTQRGGLTGG
jgi:hypothetical protein